MSMPRQYTGRLHKLVTAIAVTLSLYIILYIGHIFEYFGIYVSSTSHRAVFVAFVLALIYLLFPARRGAARDRLPWYDAALAVIATIVPLYVAFSYEAKFITWELQGISNVELVMGVIPIVLLLEATRRVIGSAMVVLAALLMFYWLYGQHLPGMLEHSVFELRYIIFVMSYQYEGLYSFITGIAATIIIMFILFGQFLMASGGAEFFIRLAYVLTGKYRGGPAKVAIVTSAFFGMISGSSSANVATTGTFTIPLMKTVGYKPQFAGAVESVASTGGQFTPPIMGAVAFVMAEWLEIPYWNIVLAAAIPAFLFYVALFLVVDVEAMRLQLRGLPLSQIPSLKETLKEGWIYIVPIAILLFFIGGLMYSPQTACLYSLLVVVIVSMFRKKTRMTPRKLVAALRGGAVGSLSASAACTTAGFVVAPIMLTGLAVKINSSLLSLSGGSLLIILAIAGVASFIMGMGMSTVAIYFVVASLIAPALIQLGVPALAGHLFVFWWGLTHHITPPVCGAVFIASAIADSKIWPTGIAAVRFGLPMYLIPFVFVYHPALLLEGSAAEIIIAAVVTLTAVVLISYGVGGWIIKDVSWWGRILLLGSGFLVLTFNWILVAIGVAVGVALFFWNRQAARRSQLAQASGGEGANSDNQRLGTG